MKQGILYIVHGDRYIKEAAYSVKTVKATHPDMHVTLFTDKDPGIYYFDDVKIINVTGPRMKIEHMYNSPYDNTLFLDSDTGIIGSLSGVFDLMTRFDIAAALDHMRKDEKKARVYKDYADIPGSFSEFNSGVVLFKKSSATKHFFEIWQKNYKVWTESSGRINDQPSFRVSLWQCQDLKIHTLPPEFNIRTKKYDNIVPRINHWHSMWRGK